MKILFEGHKYSTQKARDFLPSDYFDSNSVQPKPRVVGYHYSDEFNCPVIILPKVFLDETDCFFVDGINPEVFLEDNFISSITNPEMRNQVANFLFECSSWFYFSIKKYFQKNTKTISLFEDNLNIIDCSRTENFHTELDIVLSLLKFNKENKDLFLFIQKINKSQNNKIDWNRTINKSNPVIDSTGVPIYLETLSKKKQINADEDLIVLFLSLLKDIEKKYNISIPTNPFYNLLSHKEFSKIKQRGTYYLRGIRYKYFDDRLLTLYHLLYSYFEKAEESSIKKKRKEYLIVKNYNLVFQDMVDELLSDTDIPSKLRVHKDGKELDHIYKSKSFFEDDGIYFIGDSKYYKKGNPIEDKSIYKQFTYAKNVIQYNIDLFNEEGNYSSGIR
ncbi:MAG: LlaJI family restriction endonuclease, partial [Bacteroidota bacterium]